jgi:hypothetical protein
VLRMASERTRRAKLPDADSRGDAGWSKSKMDEW